MGGGGGGGTDHMRSPDSSSSSISPNELLNPPLIRSSHQFPQPFSGRDGAPPPIPPYSQIPATLQLKHSPEEARFSPPSPFTKPPRKSHRRSNSDVTFGFSSMKEEAGRKSDSEAMDDVFRAYMNLDVFNSFGGGNEETESRKTNGGGSSSDSEGLSTACGNLKVSSGLKRRAPGDIACPTKTGKHYRSVSMDSCFLSKFDFGDESSPLKLPPSSTNVELGNTEFTAAELKKIAADEKLAQIVMADPKRVKRILANRVSAARSKERKTQYMAELEHKVQTLQTEATTLSAQLTHLQRDSMGLTNQNSELKFRLQAMEQQAQLRDALSEKLTEEVKRLKLVIGETSRRQSGSSSSRESNLSKTTLSPEMFQQLSISQLQEQQMQHSSQKPNE